MSSSVQRQSTLDETERTPQSSDPRVTIGARHLNDVGDLHAPAHPPVRHHSHSEVEFSGRVEIARQIVLKAIARTTLLACLISLPVVALWLDVQWMGNMVGEYSATEFGQLALLVGCVLVWLRLAKGSNEDRRFATLAAGFFACMLIRESDATLDLLFDGLWQTLVILVSGICVAYSVNDWRSTLRGMARLLMSRAGVMLMVGLVLLLVYSRLLGMSALWQGLLGDGYLRVLKNAIEESTELLGYVLILIASLNYLRGRLARLGKEQGA